MSSAQPTPAAMSLPVANHVVFNSALLEGGHTCSHSSAGYIVVEVTFMERSTADSSGLNIR
jgi:hypothetical protein